jgi:hypothetical protein
VRVDGKDVANLSLSQVVSLVRGPASTTVTLTILHPGETSIVNFRMESPANGGAPVARLEGWGDQVAENPFTLEPGGYIRLSTAPGLGSSSTRKHSERILTSPSQTEGFGSSRTRRRRRMDE